MFQNWILMALVSLPASTQVFDELAVTFDGSTVYFSTHLRLRGSNLHSIQRVYRVRGRDAPQLTHDVNLSVRTYMPSVSVDGNVYAYAEDRGPIRGFMRIDHYPPRTYIHDGESAFPVEGESVLSADGRWGVIWRNAYDTAAELLDVRTRMRTGIAFPVLRGRPVNSRGEVVGFDGKHVVVHSGGERREYAPQELPALLYLDETGRQIFYIGGLHSTLRAIDRNTHEDRALQSFVRGKPAISHDGRFLVAMGPSAGADSDYQAILIDGREPPWVITNYPHGVEAVTISGDGRYVFATTALGELMRIEVATLEQDTMIPRSPYFGGMPYLNRTTAGSLVILQGRGYATAGEGVTANLEMWVGSKRATITLAQFDQLHFQVPRDTPEGFTPLTLAGPGSPFESYWASLEILSYAPVMLACEDGALSLQPTNLSAACALHEDGSFVTRRNPARPNEVVRIWMLGLGKAATSMATCSYFVTDLGMRPLTVLRAAELPGFVGIDFVDTQIPAVSRTQPDQNLWISCGRIQLEGRRLPIQAP